MSIDFLKALKAPFATEGWFGKAIVGGILMIIPFANLIISGYFIEYLRQVMNDNHNLPDFSNMGSLFVKGFKVVIGAILLAIPFIFIYVIIMMAASSQVDIITKLFQKENQALCQIITAVVTFLFYIMQLNFAMDEKISSMIDLQRASKFLQNNAANLITLIIHMIIVSILFSAVILLSMITIIGILLVPAILFLQMSVIYNMVGQFGKTAPKFPEIAGEALIKR